MLQWLCELGCLRDRPYDQPEQWSGLAFCVEVVVTAHIGRIEAACYMDRCIFLAVEVVSISLLSNFEGPWLTTAELSSEFARPEKSCILVIAFEDQPDAIGTGNIPVKW